MAYRELRPLPQAEADYEQFIGELQSALTDGRRDPNDIVRDTLFELYYGAAHAGAGRASVPQPESLSPTARAVLHNFDPRNVTTEPEYYTDIDARAYAERKPFVWL
ncbi:MAG: hypothetical protein ACRD9R_23475, partial [Pyrinomonadaceae bacterium]